MSPSWYILLVMVTVVIARSIPRVEPTSGGNSETRSVLTGYDCAHSGLNISTVALDTVPDCEGTSSNVTEESEEIQLIQITSIYRVKTTVCRVEIIEHVTHCGMYSHSSQVRNGFRHIRESLTRAQCLSMHEEGVYVSSSGIKFTDLKDNSTSTRNVVFAGSITAEGNCKGISYSNGVDSWDNVVSQGTIKITMMSFNADLDSSSNTIHLRGGVRCNAVDKKCSDDSFGDAFWEYTRTIDCDPRTHVVLNTVMAKKYTERTDGGTQVTYLVESPDKIYALRVMGHYKRCNFRSFKTEHPKLLIATKDEGHFYLEQHPVDIGSLDLMAYMNTKFVYIEKKLTQSWSRAFHQLSMQRCELERRTLANLMSLASLDAQEFAYVYMGGPGYSGVRLGEAVYVVQCVPVVVESRITQGCFQEIPVTYNNRSMFLAAKSRLLQHRGTEIDCDELLMPMFHLSSNWVTINRQRRRAPAPLTMKPEPVSVERFESIDNLASAGIYSFEDTERMRDRLMYAQERDVVSTIVSRGMTGANYDAQGTSIRSLLDDPSLEALGNRVWSRLWGWFSVFGQFASGVFGFYIAGRTLKFIIDTYIHGKILYAIYGFSTFLLAAVWDSLTTYCIHKAEDRRHATPEKDQEASAPEEVVPLREDKRVYPEIQVNHP